MSHRKHNFGVLDTSYFWCQVEKRKDGPDAGADSKVRRKKQKVDEDDADEANAPGVPEKNKVYSDEGYTQPAGQESWLWEHFWEHAEFPGYVQCWIKTGRDVLSRDLFC